MNASLLAILTAPGAYSPGIKHLGASALGLAVHAALLRVASAAEFKGVVLVTALPGFTAP